MKIIFCLALSILLFISGCQQINKPVKLNKPENKDTVKIVDNGNVQFENFFSDKTMRLDYFHAGTATEEHFSTDRIVSDGIWSGSKKVLCDKLKLGLYLFKIIDKQSKTLLYSKGFASIFGEWQTTPDASQKWGVFHESVRFPWPDRSITVILEKRDSLNNYKTIWTTDIDPASRLVNPADLIHSNKVDVITENGPASEKVDIVILGDGYSKTEMDKFRKDAVRLSGYLMNVEPFHSHKKDFNIRAIETPGESSGVNKPHHGVFKRTPLTVH